MAVDICESASDTALATMQPRHTGIQRCRREYPSGKKKPMKNLSVVVPRIVVQFLCVVFYKLGSHFFTVGYIDSHSGIFIIAAYPLPEALFQMCILSFYRYLVIHIY